MPIPSSIIDLSTTAGSNSPAGSESPSLIDDYLRTYASYIALLRDAGQTNSFNMATASGTANAITATYSPAVITLVDGMTLFVKATADNTGPATFSPNGLAAKAIVGLGNTALSAGEISANDIVQLQWNTSIGGGSWVLTATPKGKLISVRRFAVGGTYTPTAGTKKVIVTLQGGGGGGGGTGTTVAGQFAAGGGGGSGGQAKALITAGFSGVTMTIGAGGAGVNANNGATGGTTSFGSLMLATGGAGGAVAPVVTSPTVWSGGAAGSGSIPASPDVTPIFSGDGGNGTFGIGMSTTNIIGGLGGPSIFGGGGAGRSGSSGNGGQAGGQGAGGGGAANGPSSASRTGGPGADGVIIVEEYT